MSFNATFGSDLTFSASFSSTESVDAEFGAHILVPVTDYYDGEYEITPGEQAQTIPVIGKTAKRNIVVDAIPADYGRLMWSGTKLTVY